MRLLREITGLEDWPRPVNPDRQWVVGRSAMELAKAFSTNDSLPLPFRAAFGATPALSTATFGEGIPELQTALPPASSRGPRHHDLWIRGEVGGRLLGVGIEGKVDESLDQPMNAKYKAALEEREKNPASLRAERCLALSSLVLRTASTVSDVEACTFPYQVFTGIAGTLLQASREHRPVAVFLVYELITAAIDREKQRRNEDGFLAVAQAIGASNGSVEGLAGPVHYPASSLLPRDVELWLGLVRHQVV